VTIGGGRCLWIPVDLKVHVALRVRNSGVFIIGFMYTGDGDDWWWQAPTRIP
jgi:hypothetical protein